MSYYSYEGFTSDERPDPEAEERAAKADQAAEEFLGNQSDRQKDIAGRIYEQLMAGSDIDDLKPMIADLSRTATEDARRRKEQREDSYR
ncbi:hypothetical protein ABT095_35655 [Kitasatospora sp. NPDC002227]|uniref:hypothetical protein n=1 Tax=Kitasatospora sp. NPDC002227 TaxID=3154773 RepID=UPI003326E3F2